MAPNLDLETYRRIGRNAALHALGKPATPIPVRSDNTARLRLIVQTTLHTKLSASDVRARSYNSISSTLLPPLHRQKANNLRFS